MKLLISLTFLFAVSYCSTNKLQTQWKLFKEQHQKSYNRMEEPTRFKIFEENVKKVESHNKLYEKNAVSFKMGLNQFADLATEEFLQIFTQNTKTHLKGVPYKSLDADIPDMIDWRAAGAVTDVENQGSCGSSAIFSVTGALEGQNFLKIGELIPLSAQELADCVVQGGCSGGVSIEDFYIYVMENGLAAAADYPASSVGTCQRGSIPSAVIENGYVSITGNEEALKEAVGTLGPAAVVVDASNWQLYASGILGCQDPVVLNHEVLVVGYGNEDGADYWLVKNSWGAAWGEEGYIQVARNSDGNCGIAKAPSYPIV